MHRFQLRVVSLVLILLGLSSFTDSLLIAKPLSEQKVLIIHNIKHFKALFLDLLRYLNSEFSKVFVFSSKSLKQSLFERGEAKYDLVILIAPKDRLIFDRMEKIGMTEFYDRGGSLIILADPRPSPQFRKLLNDFGLDVINPDNIKEVNPKLVSPNFTHLQDSPSSPWIFVPNQKLILPFKENPLKDGIWFKGANLMLSIYENSESWPLLEAPDRSYNFFIPSKQYTRKEEIRRKIIDSDRNGLVVGAQKMDSFSRIALAGSTEMFSNTALQMSNGGILDLFKVLAKWVMFKSHVIQVEFFRVCPESQQFSDFESLLKNNKFENQDQIDPQMIYHDYDVSPNTGQFLTNYFNLENYEHSRNYFFWKFNI